MEGENQNKAQPVAAQPAEPPVPAQASDGGPRREAPRLGQRKFTPKPKIVSAGDSAKMSLDELKATIIQLAGKNFDSTMYILRSWNDTAKPRR